MHSSMLVYENPEVRITARTESDDDPIVVLKVALSASDERGGGHNFIYDELTLMVSRSQAREIVEALQQADRVVREEESCQQK